MEFRVQFTAQYNRFAIEIPQGYLGLRFVRQARRAAGLPELSLSVIDAELDAYRLDPICGVYEDEAERSGRFEDSSRITVLVPARYLNEYTQIMPLVDKEPQTGRIFRVRPKLIYEERAIISDWLDAGSPLRWGFPSDDDEDDPEG